MSTAENQRGGARVRFPPPLVFLAFILAGLGWSLVRPIGFGANRIALIVIGTLVAVVAVMLAAWAIGLFRRTGQDPAPWMPTPELIVQGPYRFTRNPMYVAMTLLQVGIGVALDNPWIVLLALPALFVVHVIAVRPEEAYLEEKFGDSYRRYRTAVRRYI